MANSLVLQGKLTLIRPFKRLDVEGSYIGWLNDAEVVRYSNQRFKHHSQESCISYCDSFNNTSNLFMSVRRLSDDCQIGTMTAYVESQHGTVDVGIMIGDKSVWSSGFGQDAWNTFLDGLMHQKGSRKLTAGTLACNYGMIKLMEHSGMTLECVRKAQEVVEGVPTDILHYAKFNDV